MRSLFFFLFFSSLSFIICFSQINPDQIDIVRDAYGVPHIFAKTDSEVAYGLAWAHAEDDFKTIQIGYLAGNGLLTKYIGNLGLGADFLSQFIGSEALFEKKYELFFQTPCSVDLSGRKTRLQNPNKRLS